MTKCYQTSIHFGSLSRRKIEADFSGGDITSDGGLPLLRQADDRIGLTRALDRALEDPRRRRSCQHNQQSLLRQRIYGIALGYEDLNDHNDLRRDAALQTAAGCLNELASAATLCRFEQRTSRETALRMHEVLFQQFVQSFKRSPRKLILDFDATDDRVHGEQEGRFFHGYYDSFCFLPLYVFCGRHLLAGYLRPSRIDAAKHSWAILSLLVKRIRAEWPKVRIVFRADSGFCRWRMLRWCERHNVEYIVGIAKNKRLQRESSFWMQTAEDAHRTTGRKQREFYDLHYAAQTWDKPRRIILKAEHTLKGSNPRYVVTNMEGDAKRLYDKLYCARGEMENRIKEQQLHLFADRTSCHKWWPNQFRLLLSGMAHTLIEAIRRIALQDTELANAQVNTIRLKLLKIGAVILRNTRRIRFLLSSAYPHQQLFLHTHDQLDTG